MGNKKGVNEMIERITKKIRKVDNNGIFHDSRHDVAELAKMINILVDKVNEIVDVVNQNQIKGSK